MLSTVTPYPASDISRPVPAAQLPPCRAFRVIRKDPLQSWPVWAVLTGPNGDVRERVLVTDSAWHDLGVAGSGPWWLETLDDPDPSRAIYHVTLAIDGTETIGPVADLAGPLTVKGAELQTGDLPVSVQLFPKALASRSAFAQGNSVVSNLLRDAAVPYWNRHEATLKNNGAAPYSVAITLVLPGAAVGTFEDGSAVNMVVPAGGFARAVISPDAVASGGVDVAVRAHAICGYSVIGPAAPAGGIILWTVSY